MRQKSLFKQPWLTSRLWLAALLCVAAPIFAQVVGTADAPNAGGAAGAPNAEVQFVDPRTAQIRALMVRDLDVALDPQSLFDVPLNDDGAIRIEVARVRALLLSLDNAKRSPRNSPKSVAAQRPDASSAAGSEAVDPAAWASRIELDRQRLEFYSLGSEQRTALLRAHAARQEAVRPRETDEARRAREAEAEHQRTLEAAKAARSDAERLVSEELARLIELERSVLAGQQHIQDRRQALSTIRDNLLGWQRRARDAKAHGSAETDITYDALRRSLRDARDKLGSAITELDSPDSTIPELGPDPLTDVPPEIPTDAVRDRRRLVEQKLQKARTEERLLRETLASTLLDEITQLNHERLELLAYLSSAKRASVTGFTEAGLDQARAELRHLLLILRYHHYIGTGWLRALREHRSPAMPSLWRVTQVAVPWLLLWLAFLWWRRRSVNIIAFAEERATESDRSEQQTTPSPIVRLVRFLRAIHRPLEWLLFFGITVWLLPTNVKSLLEVQLLIVTMGWPLGGALIVNVINALATPSHITEIPTTKVADVGALRHRSLSLVGRVVVLFALILLVSTRLVGEGTIYSWVLSTCWISAIPVFLMLVRWWRRIVFERIDLVRRKSKLQIWVLANQTGYKSFLAAMLAASQLFVVGSYKTLRSWLSGFHLARRVHAYLFKRELDRLSDERGTANLHPLGARAMAILAPDRALESWLPCPADDVVLAIHQRLSKRRGGVVAIVGDLGSGKSSLMVRLREQVTDSALFNCAHDSPLAAIQAAVDQSAVTEQEVVRAPSLVLLDDFHAIIRPVLGGLRRFDEILSFARSKSSGSLWIFSIDGVTWPFLRRARDARPMFEEVYVLKPWRDEQIGRLLLDRCRHAELEPIFDDLLQRQPLAADELDQQDARNASRIGYFRMVWDFTLGNPALALEVWRTSLVEDGEGSIRVRPLRIPDARQLEVLPDSALFVLRAILQMAPASVAEVAEVARLTDLQVQDAFSFCRAHGYLTETEGRMRISWAWLRGVVVLLKRRHLLVNS